MYEAAEPDDPVFIGIRERVDFLNRLLTFKTVTPNTGNLEASAATNVHLEWINLLYLRNRVAGESLHKLAKETHLTHDALKALLTRYGGWLRRQNKLGNLIFDISRVLRYFLAGHSESQTAREFNLPLSVATAICVKHEVFSLV